MNMTGGTNSPRIVPRHSELNIEKIRRVNHNNVYTKNQNFSNLGILSVANHDQQHHSVTKRSNYQTKNQQL